MDAFILTQSCLVKPTSFCTDCHNWFFVIYKCPKLKIIGASVKNLQIARNYLPSPGKLTFTYTSYFTAEHFDGRVHSLSVLSFAGISCSVTIYWGGGGGTGSGGFYMCFWSDKRVHLLHTCSQLLVMWCGIKKGKGGLTPFCCPFCKVKPEENWLCRLYKIN